MKPLLLAAGRGRRLRPFTDHSPKCLLAVGGRSLLERHFAAFAALGLRDCAIVIGFERAQIERFGPRFECAAGAVRIEYVYNEQFERGSIVSLHRGLDAIAEGGVVMDADVLYEPAVLERLLRAPFENGFLLDETAAETGEEMMLGALDGRVMAIDRRVGTRWDTVGEGVGFFKIGARAVPVLQAIIGDLLARGQDGVEYEVALSELLRRDKAGYVKVGDLAWTEIDFATDLDKATTLLPRIDGR